MDQKSLELALSALPIPAVRYFASISSTNDEASRWAEQGAPHLALVAADEQTSGRGRLGRSWTTVSGAALAFSLVLRPPYTIPDGFTRLTALGALSLCGALESLYHLSSKIKWPNDVLLNGRKTAGILAEAAWEGSQLSAVILGIGINVTPASISEAALPGQTLNFPATCVEAALGQPVDRLELLRSVLSSLVSWLPALASDSFLHAWEDRLAYKGEWVRLASNDTPAYEGQVLGLEPDGCLRLRTRSGNVQIVRVGEIRLQGL